MESIRQTFFQECEDLLSELENGLLRLNSGESDDDTIDSIFRAVHSIKGGAGAFDLTALVSFSHTFENVLDDLRSDRTQGDSGIYETLLESSDMLHDLVSAARDDTDWDHDKSNDLLNRLKELSTKDNVGDDGDTDPVDEDFGFQPMTLSLDLGATGPGIDLPAITTPIYEIVFKPRPELFSKGHAVTRLLRHLNELGQTSVDCDTTGLPEFDSLNPEDSLISWEITLESTSTKEEILEVFDFVVDDCELNIEEKAPEDTATDDRETSNPLDAFLAPPLAGDPEAPEAIAPAIADVEGPVAKPESDATAPTPVAETPADKIEVKKKVESSTAIKKQAPPATIRINLERVDRLINQVGELVINQAMLTQCVTDVGLVRDPSVQSALDEFKQLTRDIQESVMAIRAQPVQPLFQRMSRIVREAAQATDKKAQLVMEGEFTEVDKTIVEKLADPLTHMIRNAIDHGLEMPDDRTENGKDAIGTVKLSAAHRSGKIVIEVSDDGAGINREKVKSLAIKKELIPADADLTDTEIDNLLFMPGFSTVDNVSTLSGRGVGMDVVKRAIQSFGGRITIASEPGKGSIFTINLPLTLAVLDGMLVEVAGQTLVIPLTSIVETLLPKETDVHNVSPSDQVINVRGSFIPLVDLGRKLNFERHNSAPPNRVALCIETEDGVQSALLVDAIQDQRQVVIKSLEDNYGHVPYIAAATILGDGRIALILDIDDLVSDTSSSLTIPPTVAQQEQAHV